MKMKFTAILLAATILLALTACGTKYIKIPENATAVDVLNAIYPFDIPLPEGAHFSEPCRRSWLDTSNAKEIGIVDAADGGFTILDTYANAVVYVFKIDSESELSKLNIGDTFVLHSYELEATLPEDCPPDVADSTYTVTAINGEYILAIYETRDKNDRIRTVAPFLFEQDQKVYENFCSLKY